MMESVSQVDPGSDSDAEESPAHTEFVNRLMSQYVSYLTRVDPELRVIVLDKKSSLYKDAQPELLARCQQRMKNRHGVLLVDNPPRKIVFYPVIVFFTKVCSDGGLLIIEMGFKGTTVAFDFYAMNTTSTATSAIKSALHFNSYIFDVHMGYVFDIIQNGAKPLPYAASLSTIVTNFRSSPAPRNSECVLRPVEFSYGSGVSSPLTSGADPNDSRQHGSGVFNLSSTSPLAPPRSSGKQPEVHLLHPSRYNEITVEKTHVYRTCAIAVLDKIGNGVYWGDIYVVARRVLSETRLEYVTWTADLEKALTPVLYECQRQLTNSITENESTAKLKNIWKQLLKRRMPYDDAVEWTSKLYQTDVRQNVGGEPGLEALSAVPLHLLRSALSKLTPNISESYTKVWIPGASTTSGIFLLAPPDEPDGSLPLHALLVYVDGDKGTAREVLVRCQARVLSGGTALDLGHYEITQQERKLVQSYVHAVFHALWVKL